MAPLTAAPFVGTAWLLLFALYQFGQLRPTEPIHPMLVHPGATIQTGLQAPAGGGDCRVDGGRSRQRLVSRNR